MQCSRADPVPPGNFAVAIFVGSLFISIALVVAGGTPAWLHVEQNAPKVPRWRYRETLGQVRKIDSNHVRLRRQP